MSLPQNSRMSGQRAIAGSTLLVVAATWLSVGTPQTDEEAWISANLTAAEVQDLQQLARQIVRLGGRPEIDGASSELHKTVRGLTIREAAGLGTFLLRADYQHVVWWIKLSAERELLATWKLRQLLTRFDDSGPWYPALQTTIRGPQRLRTLCGDALLTEITGAAFRMVDNDDGISSTSDLADKDLQTLLELPGLERISIEFAQVTDAGVARLATLPRLREIHLVGCAQLTDESLRALVGPRLQHLDLAATSRISDSGVAHLARCPNLKALVLEGTGVTSAALRTIAGCRKLTELSLSQTAVREGLDQLRSLRQLEKLRLAHLGTDEQPVPWESLRFLSDFKDLTSLDLDQTAIRRVELRHLPKLVSLPVGHRILRELVLVDLPRLPRLEFSTIWWPNPHAMRLEEVALEGLTDLNYLILRGLTEPACEGLARGLPDSSLLEQIYLTDGQMTDRLADSIGKLTRLERLHADAAAITSRQRQSILLAPRLHDLNCCGERLTADDWQAFGRSGLKKLQIQRLDVGDVTEPLPWRAVEHLALYQCRIGRLVLNGLPALRWIEIVQGRIEELHLTDCSQLVGCSIRGPAIGDLKFDACQRMESFFAGSDTKLSTVTLNDLPQLANLTIQERASVRELRLAGLPKMKHVSFWMADISAATLEALLEFPALARLDISNTQLGDDAATIISRLVGIEHLSASSRFTRSGLEQLRQLRRLETINLYRRPDADWSKEEVRQLLPGVRYPCVFDVP